MNKVLKKAIQFLIFFAIGAFIFWLVYKDQDIERIKSVLKNDVNYFWIFISVIIRLLSHISRTVRWRIMIQPIGHSPSFINTFLAVMIGYLMNLAFPRMGEISRCGVMARYEKLSFTKLLGTVVSERVVDMISLLLLLLIVVISQFGKILEFLYKNPEIENRLLGIVSSPVLIIGILLFIIFVFIFRKTLKNTTLYKKVVAVLINLKYGIISIRSIEKKGWFLFHSVAIWGLYYLMLYVVFFAFDFTRNLPFCRINNVCACQFRNGCPGARRNRNVAFHGYRIAGALWRCQGERGGFCLCCPWHYDRNDYYIGHNITAGFAVCQPQEQRENG